MTSDEIKQNPEFTPDWLREIAYQLAVMNEAMACPTCAHEDDAVLTATDTASELYERMRRAEADLIVAHLSQKFGMTPQECESKIAKVGIPILADDCTVVLNDPQRWAG